MSLHDKGGPVKAAIVPAERGQSTSGTVAKSTKSQDDRFVMVPLRTRRDHDDWPDDEHAVWLDLYLASYEFVGRFESLEMMTVIVGKGRAFAVEKRVRRGAVVEDGDDWILLDYAEQYDGRVPRARKSLADRLADANAKIAAGEPLNGAERWARWRARQDGVELPDLRFVRKAENETETKTETKTEPTLEPTLANEPTPIHRLGNLYEAFTQLTGLPCTPADRSRIANLCRDFDRDMVRKAMYADTNPTHNPDKFIGRTWHRLQEAA